METKTKHYLTSKRKWEIKKQKAFVLFMAILIGVGSIGISYLGLVTPLMANSYDLTSNTPVGGKFDATEASGELTVQEHVWKLLIEEGGLSFEEALEGMMIVNCESKFNEWAIGDSGKSTGLWQIHSSYHKDISIKDTFDVYAATRWAIKKYIDSGRSWKLWSCSK